MSNHSWWLSSEESSCRRRRRWGPTPELGGSPGGGNGNPLQYSCQENPVDRGAWWAQSLELQRVQRERSGWTHIHTSKRALSVSRLSRLLLQLGQDLFQVRCPHGTLRARGFVTETVTVTERVRSTGNLNHQSRWWHRHGTFPVLPTRRTHQRCCTGPACSSCGREDLSPSSLAALFWRAIRRSQWC